MKCDVDETVNTEQIAEPEYGENDVEEIGEKPIECRTIIERTRECIDRSHRRRMPLTANR